MTRRVGDSGYRTGLVKNGRKGGVLDLGGKLGLRALGVSKKKKKPKKKKL
jgi:hypothetical protein